jgi:hypothetical protein
MFHRMKRWMVLCLLAAGCAQENVWQKPSASPSEAQRDFYECERDTRASASSFSGGLQGAGEAQAFYGRCLSARGYSLAPAGAARVQPTPMRDATGRTYVDDDRVTCTFSNGSTVTFSAKVCSQGGGTILGRAT